MKNCKYSCKIRTLVELSWLCAFAFAIIFPQVALGENLSKKKKRPTVALVLSGGGAKGFAHAGVLEAIEALDIPIDYIVGTSMGSIVGGLYATGFSARDLLREIETHDWEKVFADKVSNRKIPVNIKDESSRYAISFPIKGGIQLPQGIIKGQQVINLLSFYTLKYHNTDDFNKLPIPFACVAVDLETGEDIVIDQGFLPEALRASMAIPTVFTPITIKKQLLVDGGVINNFPADIAKKRGVDYIIGVDVQSPLRKRKDLKSVTDVLSQLISFSGKVKNDKNKKLCDVYINPDVTGYTVGSFSRAEVDSIVKRGKEAGQKAYPQLLKLKQKLGVESKTNKTPLTLEKDIKFNHLSVKGLRKIKDKDFIKKLNLKEKYVSIAKLDNLIEDLTASLNLDLLSYRMKKDTLEFIAHEKNSNRFNVGVNYNSDNNANVLLNTTYYNKVFKNTRISLDAILGTILEFKGRCTASFKSTATLNFIVNAKNYKPSLFEKKRKVADGDVSFLKFDFNAQFMLWDSYSGGFGIREEYIAVDNTISLAPEVPHSSYDWYTSYYAFIRLNTLDDRNYPTEGIRFDAEARYLVNNKNPNSGLILYANIKKAYNVSNKVGIVAHLQGRTVIDNKTGIYFQNTWGGLNSGKYIDYHIPFLGTRWMQGVNNAMATARMDFRYELFPNNYLILAGNYGRYTDDIHDILSNKVIDLWGGGITFSYDSLIGPLSITLMQSNIVKRPLLYINIGYKF